MWQAFSLLCHCTCVINLWCIELFFVLDYSNNFNPCNCMIYQVKDPSGTQIHDYRDKTSEKFEFMAQKRGLYRFCFTNKSPYHETIDFDVYIGHFSYFEQHAKDGKTLITVLELVITVTCDECGPFSLSNYFVSWTCAEHFGPLLEQIGKLEEALYNIQFEQHWLEAQTDRQAIGMPDEFIATLAHNRLPHLLVITSRIVWLRNSSVWHCLCIFLFARRVRCYTHWFAPSSEWIIYTTISHHQNFHIDFHNYYWWYSLVSQARLILSARYAWILFDIKFQKYFQLTFERTSLIYNFSRYIEVMP